MTPLLAILEFGDYAVIAVIVIIFAGGASFAAQQRLDLHRVERKLDAVLKHHSVEFLSPEVQLLAKDPSKRITAIKLHREQNPGLGLADAKREIEDFARSPSDHAA
jgi:ribosomal protein L7/L12